MVEKSATTRGVQVKVRGRLDGFDVELAFILERIEALPAAIGRLVECGLEREASAWTYDADGLPLCPKHAVAMRLRAKQGDQWHSHVIRTHDGAERYCRGRPGSDSPGWYVDPGEIANL
jgi:hypothetical protein